MPEIIHRRRVVRALAVLGCAAGLLACAPASAEDVVTVERAREDMAAGKAVMFDIREPGEQAATGLAPGARSLPLSQMGQRVAELPTDGATPVYLICNTQNRSSNLLKSLRERGGYSHVRYVRGGMTEWLRQGYPTVKSGG